MKKAGLVKMTAAALSVLMITMGCMGCGSKNGKEPAGAPAQSGEAKQGEGEPSGQEQNGQTGSGGAEYTGGSYKISIGHICSEQHTIHQVCLEFKKQVEEESGGKITVEIHPNSELGGDEAMLESVALGTLTMVIPSATIMSGYVPEFEVLGMPYLFESTDQAFETIDGGLGTLLNQKLLDANTGFTNLGYNFNGIRNMTNNKRPIRTPEDLKGLKMRCMSNQIFVQMFESLGANATPMSWSELFTAMQQGTVDGEENPASLIYESKFNEVQKYLSTTEHIYDFCTIIIGTSFYDGLDEQAKEIVTKAAHDTLITMQRGMEADQNAEYIDKLEQDGMEVTRLTTEERKAFAEKVQTMYEGWEKKYGQDIVDAIEQYRN